MQQKNKHIERELIAITRQFLIDSEEPYHREIRIDSSLQRHLGIDSLGRAELIDRIEKKFSVTLPDTILSHAETLNDIAKYLLHSSPQLDLPMDETISHEERTSVDPSLAHTLMQVLLQYGELSPDKTHIFFQHESGEQEKITYKQLLDSSLKVAQGLKLLDLKENETVAIMQPTHPDFFYAFFGVLFAGGVPVPIYPPFRMHMLEEYAKTEAHILRNAEVRILITFMEAEKLSQVLKAFVPSLHHISLVKELIRSEPIANPFTAKESHSVLIQYTSGSTNLPKGVLLTHHNLLSNIRAYGKAINITAEDVVVSWLPLYHDMGLIGMWLGSLYHGIPLVLLTPFTFLNHPEKWLWAIHHHRATLTGGPNFAYELCVRKIDLGHIEGLDLSSLRIAANGAEKVYPQTLRDFVKKFAPFGLKSNVLLPVYGLAESTVCLTIPPVGREMLIEQIERAPFENENIARASQSKNALSFVGCGKPIDGQVIKIVDDDGDELPDRHVGHLYFKGSSMMKGYYNNPDATNAILHDGWYDSGDLAYQTPDDVFITGRSKDLIIKTGRNIYPAEIEELVGNIHNIRQGCVAAFGINDETRATEQLIIVAETREQNKTRLDQLSENIKNTISAAMDIVPDHVILVAPHIVPKTSSGKLQRSACKKMYLEGQLGKSPMPAWWQLFKLAGRWFVTKSLTAIATVLKFIYTVYVTLVYCITYVPLYLGVYFSDRPFGAKIAKTWSRFILRAALCPIDLINEEKLTQESPMIFAANHASYMDALVVIAILPTNMRMIGKKELLTMPMSRMFMRKLGYIGVDRLDTPKGVENTKDIVNILLSGASVMIFPEGTFSYSVGLRPFRLGAFKIATETNIPICPIALSGTRFIMRDGERLLKPGKIRITVCDPIKPKGQEWQDVTQLRNAVRKEIAIYCGEPSLDFIAAHPIAPRRTR